jgi:2-dehydropantoate 2-reductase
MKIAMIGAGGVGGYFGAGLQRGGAEVHFIARGAHLEAIARNGLRIEGPGVPIVLADAKATDAPASVGVCDLVAICVKLWDTQTVLEQIRPLVGPGTTLVSFQNGVTKRDLLRRAFPANHVMDGVAYVATTIDRPGVIRRTGPLERLVVGEIAGGPSELGEGLVGIARKGGINAELSADVTREVWQKFVFLVGLSATTTAMRSRIGPIRENPLTRAFLLDIMREVVAVGRALGVELAHDYAEQRLAFADGVSPDMTSSMHHDLERGNRLELPWLSGAVVELGDRAGVATPLNRAVRDVLVLHGEGTFRREAPSP